MNPPQSWADWKARLKQHYRPKQDQLGLTRKINSLRESSMKDLDDKVRELMADISEVATFDENRQMMDIFGGMLFQRIKEISAGSFAFAFKKKNGTG